MKPRIDEVIVVEGRDDTINILRAVEALTIETHGFGIRKDTWEALEKADREKGLILFTDPDHSGEEIRRKLSERFPHAKHACLSREDARKNGDIGVENASPEAILSALRNCRARECAEREEIFSVSDLKNAGLSGGAGSGERREKLGKLLGIGYGNAKGLLRKLNGFGITREEFDEAVRTIDNTGDPGEIRIPAFEKSGTEFSDR